jgi:hypothetical protein
MTLTDQLSPEIIKAIGKIEKLLNHSAKAGTPEESALFAAKASELLTLYNLDASTIEANGGGAGRREDTVKHGGIYAWQRALWQTVAETNFCMYWTQEYRTPRARGDGKIVDSRRHRLVGKLVNVRSAIVIAEYLEGAIERITRDYLGSDAKKLYSRSAHSFRDGATETMVGKLRRRYEERLAEDRAKTAAAAKEAAPARNALTLTSLIRSEYDANQDFLYGEGWSARNRAAVAKARAEREQAERDYIAWARNNPEEHAANLAAAAAEEAAWERHSRRRKAPPDRTDYTAFSAGREKAKDIGLDRQADFRARPALDGPKLGD